MVQPPLLMHPGPVLLHPDVLAAMSRPDISHHDRDFYELFDGVCAMLGTLHGTKGKVAVLPGSGRLGLEAAIVSLCRPGDRTLHVVNGAFGAWTAEIARRVGCQVTVLDLPWDQPVDPDEVARALSDRGPFQLVTVVHSETSTGQLNPVASIGPICRAAGTLVLVDAVSSLAVAPLAMDDWGIDICVSASQKGMCAPLGLSTVALGPRALGAVANPDRGPAQSYSLDLRRWNDFWSASSPRPYPVVPSLHLVYALHASLRQIMAEGPDQRIARHARVARAVRSAVSSLGLSPWAMCPSPSVTSVGMPLNLTAVQLIDGVRERGVLIADGFGRAAGQMVRISHMGMQATLEPLTLTFTALAGTLQSLGHSCVAEDALQALRAGFAEEKQ